jgi:hypothetical protein
MPGGGDVTAPDLLEVYAPIMKKERDPQTGHLYVYGKITGSDLDNDQQRMDPAWLKTAVPDWFRIGNLRLQHDPKTAIGKALELEEKNDGWYIGAKVVDQDAIVKVEEDVLTGFSIGVKNHRLDFSNKADAPNGTCVAGRIVEASLVDAPCLGSAKISEHWRLPLAKADGSGELHAIEDPVLERATSPTYGLPAELFDRLASPVKQALADLAASGAQVAAEPVEATAPDAAKADAADPPMPLVVNVTVQTPGPAVADARAAAEYLTHNGDRERLGLAPAHGPDPDLDKAYSAQEKRDALAAGQAMKNPDGDPAYTIKTKSDLRKAIKAVGRGGADHDAIRKHVIKRAKALGLEAMVPENWNADGTLKGDAKKADADPAMIEKAEALLREVRALVPDLAKADGEDGDGSGGADGDGDESGDIAGAQEAIAVIAKLIVSEAESLALGNLNEACDIALLLDAVRALKWFQSNERAEQSGSDGAVMMLADAPAEGDDLLKADGKKNPNLAPPFKKKDAKDGDGESDGEDGADADGADDDAEDEKPAARKKAPAKTAAKADDATEGEPLLTKAEAADLVTAAVTAALLKNDAPETSPAVAPETVTKAELAEMVKSAVAQARAADEERLRALTVDLAKASAFEAVKDLPQPGGPALTRTAAQQGAATKSDSDTLHAQAKELLAKAEQFSANRDLAQGYRDRARALLAKAAA